MKWIGLALFLLGLAVMPISCFVLAGSAFVSSGRHAREQLKFPQGTEQRLSFDAKAGVWLEPSVYLLVDRRPFPIKDGLYALDYDVPVRFVLSGPNGAELRRFEGTIKKGDRGVREMGTAASVGEPGIIEKNLDGFTTPERGRYQVAVTLEADKGAKLVVTQPYVLIYDQTSPELYAPTAGVVAGALMSIGGIVLFIVGLVRGRRARA